MLGGVFAFTRQVRYAAWDAQGSPSHGMVVDLNNVTGGGYYIVAVDSNFELLIWLAVRDVCGPAMVTPLFDAYSMLRKNLINLPLTGLLLWLLDDPVAVRITR